MNVKQPKNNSTNNEKLTQAVIFGHQPKAKSPAKISAANFSVPVYQLPEQSVPTVGFSPADSVSSAASAKSDAEKSGVSNEQNFLQSLVDRAAIFNVYTAPHTNTSGSQIRTNNGEIIGFKSEQILHHFDIELDSITTADGVKAKNALGEVAGGLSFRWRMIPPDFFARPDSEPPPLLVDVSRSQRFVMQKMTFRFGNGQDGFESFGTGRTFPMFVNGKPKLVVAAIGSLTKGFGKFHGYEGNFTLCGNLDAGQGFSGHLLVRILDHDGRLRATGENFAPATGSITDPDSTYLMWTAQKGTGKDQENYPSFDLRGEVQGLNIPMNLKRGSVSFTTQGEAGFRYRQLEVGEVIGREEGFGKGSIPGADPAGNLLSPFLFEGVAVYSFHDANGQPVGALKSNVLEGRRFDFNLPEAPGKTAWRFGFFGPIIEGFGCFRGVTGIFYGASASVFNPPPGDHIITHIYMARLFDRQGRFRANGR